MISIQFILFAIPFICGSMCEAKMDNENKIHLARMEQRFNQQINTLQQKHENSLSHLQSHMLNLEKENQLLQSKLKSSVKKLEEKNESLEKRLAICEKKLQQDNKENRLNNVDTFLNNQNSLPIAQYLFSQPEIDPHVPINNIPIEDEEITAHHLANDQNQSVVHDKDPRNVQINNLQNIYNNENSMNENDSNKLNLLERKINERINEDVSLKNQIREIKQQQEEERQKVSVMSEHLSMALNQRSTFVSFTAYATADRDYNEDDTVLFDGIVSNYGGHYNLSSSIFTCPHSGFYLFSVNIRADGTYQMGVDMRIDGDHILSTSARDADYTDHASLTTVQLCQQGASVWVRCRYDSDRMHGDGSRYSSFTGTLLRII